MNTDTQLNPVTTTHWMRRIVFATALYLGVFLLGFVPMWRKAWQYAQRLAEAERQLNLTRIHNALISAIISVWQDKYEPARQATSAFFTLLQAETDGWVDTALAPAQIEDAQMLLAQRDEIITLLAQSNPVAGERLADLYGLYYEIMNR